MRCHSSVVLAGAVLMMLSTLAGPAAAVCTGDSPDAVLDCYSDAYSSRDIEALESLLAEDYTWIAVTYPRAQTLERDELMVMNRNACTDERTESLSLEFSGDYTVVDGHDEGTWRIEGLVVTMGVKMVDADEAHETSVCLTLYVRALEGDTVGYQIYREVTFEGGGCEEL